MDSGVSTFAQPAYVLMVCCSLANDLTVRMPASTSCAVAEAAAAAVSWLVTYFLFKPAAQHTYGLEALYSVHACIVGHVHV